MGNSCLITYGCEQISEIKWKDGYNIQSKIIMTVLFYLQNADRYSVNKNILNSTEIIKYYVYL